MVSDRKDRRVTFSDEILTRRVPRLHSGEVAELFYNKLDFRRFKSDSRLEQDLHVSKLIQRFIDDALDDMDDRMAHAEKVQDIEQILLAHSKKLDQEIKLRDSRPDEDDLQYEEWLRQESHRLDEEQAEMIAKHRASVEKNQSLYIESDKFREISSGLEDSCSSLLNFQPVDFDIALGNDDSVSAIDVN